MASGSVRCAFPSPSCSAEQRSAAGGSRRGLSEGHRPEFRSRPASRVAQGSRQRRPRNAGVAFSLASFFWRPKRKNARASGAEHSASELHHLKKQTRHSNPLSDAITAACTRELTFSLRKMCCTWIFTVVSAMSSARAISLLLEPRAISRSTSSSRGDSGVR